MSIFIFGQQKNTKQIDKIILRILTHQTKITKLQSVLSASLVFFSLRCNG